MDRFESDAIERYKKFVLQTLDNFELIQRDIKYFSEKENANIIVAVDTEEIISFALSHAHLLVDMDEDEKTSREANSIAQTYVLFNKDTKLGIEKELQFYKVILLPSYVEELLYLLRYWSKNLHGLKNQRDSQNPDESVKFVGKVNKEIKKELRRKAKNLLQSFENFKNIKESSTQKQIIRLTVDLLARKFRDFYLAITGSTSLTLDVIRRILFTKDSPVKVIEGLKDLRDLGLNDTAELEKISRVLNKSIEPSYGSDMQDEDDKAILDIEECFAEIPRRKNADLPNYRDAVVVYLVDKFNTMLEKNGKKMVLFSDAPSMRDIRDKVRDKTGNDSALENFEVRDSNYFINFLSALPTEHDVNLKKDIDKYIREFKGNFEQYKKILDYDIADITSNDNNTNNNYTIINPWKDIAELSNIGKEDCHNLLKGIENKISDLLKELSNHIKNESFRDQQDIRETTNDLGSLISKFNNCKENKKQYYSKITDINKKMVDIVDKEVELISNVYNSYKNLKYIYHRDKFLNFYNNEIKHGNDITKTILSIIMYKNKDLVNKEITSKLQYEREAVNNLKSVVESLEVTVLHNFANILTNNNLRAVQINFRRLTAGYPWEIKFKNKAIEDARKKFTEEIRRAVDGKSHGKETIFKSRRALLKLVNLTIKDTRKDGIGHEDPERILLKASIFFSFMYYYKAYRTISDFLKTESDEAYRNDKLRDLIALEFLILRKLLKEKELYRKQFVLLKDKYWKAKNGHMEEMDPRILNIIAVMNYDDMVKKEGKGIGKNENPIELLKTAIKNVENNKEYEENCKKRLKLLLLNNLIYIKLRRGLYIESTTKSGKNFLIENYTSDFVEDIETFKSILISLSIKKDEKVKNFYDLYKKEGKSELYRIWYEIPETIAEIECYYLKNAALQGSEEKYRIRDSINKWIKLYNKSVKNLPNGIEESIDTICTKVNEIIKKHL